MTDLETQILAAVGRRAYTPLKPKALAGKLGYSGSKYAQFRSVLRKLLKQGRLELGKNQTVRQAPPHGTATGVFRKAGGGFGFVRPHPSPLPLSPGGRGGKGQVGPDIYIPEDEVGDAATGDEVLVRIRKKPNHRGLGPRGEIVQVVERATRQFVGTYFERDGQGYVRVDGTVFAHSIYVGDPGAKGARPDDKVVVEMLRFPSPDDRGEAVITEILGPRGKPGVDTLSILREFNLPDKFPESVLAEARTVAASFDDADLIGRDDLTNDLTITIDPADAHDFDDAVSLTRDPKSGHWQLGVHIADVAHFVAPGSELDREAKNRGNSVYLPQRVLPMLPEVISNSLASLQQGRVRFVKSVFIDFTPQGQRANVRFANAAICVRRRFNYDEVSAILAENEERRTENRELRTAKREEKHADDSSLSSRLQPEVLELLLRMRELALILRARRRKHGALELSMPEIELELDEHGRVSGAHFAKHDISHQMIEEFMLSANEAVAERLDDLDVPFLRRVHPAPAPEKLKAFAEFARILGYKMGRETDRFTLQRVLEQSADKPEVHAVHYALLRSLKQAVYSPEEEGHYALASENYCHFTSPIRRYPDLTVHRLLDRWLRTGRAASDPVELAAVGEHCSKTERRADVAERELIKTKLLTYLSQRVGLELDGIVTGVADYGFYAQAATLPIEGLVHVSTLTDDYYYFEEASHSLIGKRMSRRFRLGDKVHVKVVRVDVQRRLLDLRVTKKTRAKEE